jgi:hypothetical protein
MKALIEALDLAKAGKWDEAHQLVQDREEIEAYWIHAVLHKIEGDAKNSRYWYEMAGKAQHSSMQPAEEFELIRKTVSTGTAKEETP